MKAAEWIDRVKRERGWDSDYRVAKELGVGRATVSKYRQRDTTFDEETSIKVAELLGTEPEIIIIDQVAERSRSEEARAALTRVLDKITRGGGGALIAALAIAAGVALPSRSDAAAAFAALDDAAGGRLYIMSNYQITPIQGFRCEPPDFWR